MNRFACTIASAVLPIVVYWMGGGEFERSVELAAAVGFAAFFGAWQWVAPWWWW